MATTGLAPLPDVGLLVYNGVQFSSLFKSKVTFKDIFDNANRAIKYTEWTIHVEGMVTLEANKSTIDSTMSTMLRLLTKPGGILRYSGKGLGTDVVVNLPVITNTPPINNLYSDVAWGPKPQVLDFQPMGASRSALISWTVTTCLNRNAAQRGIFTQFNEEISLSYDEEGYALYSIRGTMEIPLRLKQVDNPFIDTTIDDYRFQFMDRVGSNIDLTRYRITKRKFDVSRDRRTMEWEFLAEQLPPMPLPWGATSARGTYSVRPLNQGVALFPWVCSLKCSYVIRGDGDRRLAWAEFATLLKFRMEFCSKLGGSPKIKEPPKPPELSDIPFFKRAIYAVRFGFGDKSPIPEVEAFNQALKAYQKDQANGSAKALLVHFGFDEGLYLDSKTVSFEASWQLMVRREDILLASGLWNYQHQGDPKAARTYWAATMRNIMGAGSWNRQRVNPAAEVVIDLGVDPTV